MAKYQGCRSIAEFSVAKFVASTTERFLAVLKAYCDDSTQGRKEKKVLCLGGAIAEVETWKRLADKWVATLKGWGAPNFRASSLANLGGNFKGWSRKDADHLFRQLVDVVGESQIIPVGATLVLSDYEALDPASRTLLRKPYEFCAERCVAIMDATLANPPWGVLYSKERVMFVLEDGPHPRGSIQEQWKRAVKGPALRLVGCPVWVGKDACVELQVGDLMAYESAKEALRMLGVLEKRRGSLRALADNFPGKFVLYDAHRLELRLDEIRGKAESE